MPKSAILIPTFDRPELLWLCLEHVREAVRPPAADIWIAPETRKGHFPSPQYAIVAEKFRDLWPHWHYSPSHSYPGNSYNVLSALKAAYEKGYGYIFVIEDDVLVSRDFFDWNLSVLAQGDYFCSTGYAKPTENKADPEAYSLTGKGYSALGVCFPRASLEAIVPHIVPAYFGDMASYCAMRFPDSPMQDEGTEQDGLILRIMVEQGGKMAYPHAPRCLHAGYYGYHQAAPRPQGKLLEKVETIRDFLSDSRCFPGVGERVEPYLAWSDSDQTK